ncbi:dnaJ homolog subfamily C member 10 isoform X3 [Scleropages formosus]|uniref:dnaJ homolog subfamily C member 10 isoform X3 n=1 Tax=Scleropages formosus TaxID=113540 RepID=UPI000879130B|nr:dnaJ homolog subfamily C member 10 isoform X3 [Scleropages formosus]
MTFFTPEREPCRVFKRPCGNTLLALIIIIASLVAISSTDEDYYGLLGVTKEASSREIRRAFKKHALATHPDTNPKSEGVHTRFLRVRRAYEVLTDEDLRRKYDRYGEKGLQDSQEIDGYRSYDFYRYDFGVYDDDLEIITLDREDFDMAVNSGELWFVNFYFPNCADCHDLEPTWREFAKEMEGLLRVAAVDCGYSGDVCKRKGITSYPTFLLIKAGMDEEKYLGDRSKESLTNFTMQFVKNKVTELWQGNVFGEIERAFVSGIGWIITFCAETGDCLSSEARQKLAGMLDGLANVGWMDCSRQPDLCASFDVTSSTTAYFSPSIQTEKQSTLFLQSLDTKEIYSEVLQRMPDVETLTKDIFSDKVARHRWLVSFSFGQAGLASHKYKKLKVLLKDLHIQVGKVDCITQAELCGSLYIQEPSIVVFKGLGINEFEIYHGGDMLYEVASFAKDSVRAHVTTLRPGHFPSDRKEPWLVEFFIPRCPPCHTLLPELRKASVQLFGQVKFGTLDCTVLKELCRKHNIRSYPTMVLFNQSSIHGYEGRHSAEGIVDFVEHLVNPVVVTLTPDTFQKLVKRRESTEAWLVDFYVPWCGPCQALLPEWRKVARMFSGIVRVGTVDCGKYQSFCEQEDVQAYPEIRLFPQSGSHPDRSYGGWSRDAASLRTWALESLPRASEDLSPEDLRKHVYSGKEHWVLDFSAPWCEPCQDFAPEFELLAHMMKGSVRAGKVDCHTHSQACEKAGIKSYPTVRFYPYLGSSKQDQAGEPINSRDASGMADALRRHLRQLSARSPRTSAKVKDEL